MKQDTFVDPDGSDGGVPGVVFTGTLSARRRDDPDGQLRFMLVGKDGKPVTELKTEYGTIVLTYETAADGSIITHYKYTLDNESTKLDEALNKLQNGETLPDGAKVVVVDPHGKVSEEQKDLTINIHKPTTRVDGTGERASSSTPTRVSSTARWSRTAGICRKRLMSQKA